MPMKSPEMILMTDKEVIESMKRRFTITLSDYELFDLTTYILMTRRYRKAEEEAWNNLAAEKDRYDEPRFPNAAGNAQFWRDISARLERTREKIEMQWHKEKFKEEHMEEGD